MINIFRKKKELGFTIVELLVVIVVIGILASITLVSYAGVTSRANTASGQTGASTVASKVAIYSADGPTNTWPTTFGSLTNATTTEAYYLAPPIAQDFAIISNGATAAPGKVMSATTRAYVGPVYGKDSLDFQLCGTSGTVTAPASYSAITIPSGVILGYWNYSIATPALNTVDNTLGYTSGNYPLTSSNPVACFQ
jgi:prepilin-type N-terminal cleavage/methylation domain-containing protein